MEFVDRELTCVQCSKTFIFSSGEQQYFFDKGFNNDPKRCKQCNALGGRRVRVETRVKCSECGIDTTVPFKPTGKRPVLCSACFKKQANHPQTSDQTA
jgi:CxxC-x17-CxxC domain-containing protein